ncbi:MAG: hypothetical protein M3Y93_13655 [Pseudomonadota bacterium]|nr:hypothetical protein [Pseudomonadota bacterium]
MRYSLPSMRRSRHPLARVLSLLIGAAVLGVLLVFGLVVAGVLLVGGVLLLVVRQWKLSRSPSTSATTETDRPATVLEGEYKVLRQGRPVTH